MAIALACDLQAQPHMPFSDCPLGRLGSRRYVLEMGALLPANAANNDTYTFRWKIPQGEYWIATGRWGMEFNLAAGGTLINSIQRRMPLRTRRFQQGAAGGIAFVDEVGSTEAPAGHRILLDAATAGTAYYNLDNLDWYDRFFMPGDQLYMYGTFVVGVPATDWPINSSLTLYFEYLRWPLEQADALYGILPTVLLPRLNK